MADAASELEALAYRLRAAGQGQLVRDLNKAIRNAVAPVPDQIRAGLKPKLPDRYAEVLDEDLIYRTRIRTGSRDPGVTLAASERGTVSGKRRRLWRLNRGVLEHPLFGDRDRWYQQPVGPQWFTGPAEAAGPRVRAQLEKVLEDFGAHVTRGA